ncbi:MAG: hypothetical protein WD034_03975 [Parvibaculum sp.]
MRYSAFVLLAAFAIGSADAHAANPYEVFRLGMSEAEIVAAAEAHGGRILTPEELQELKLVKSRKVDEFRTFFAEIPMEPHQAMGYFALERDHLQQIVFNYFVWLDRTPPGICSAILEQATREIGEVYGIPSNSDAFAGTDAEFRGKTVNWSTDEHTVSLFTTDAPPHSSPGSCDIVQAHVFAGTQTKREAFDARLSEAVQSAER